MRKPLKKPIFLITDRNLTLDDSVSRYIIDLAEELLKKGRRVLIFTTKEVKKQNYHLLPSSVVKKGLPAIKTNGIYHFHLTFSLRKHSHYLLNNLEELNKKSLVTLHVTPEYALKMGQKEEMEVITRNLAQNEILVHVFSNYAKYELKKYGVAKVLVIYPGLNLNRYSKFLRHAKVKKEQILLVASNPDEVFVQKVKNFCLLSKIKEKYKNYCFKKVINNSFDKYLTKMAQSKFLAALSNVEHYSFSIIDAYNLFTIPIYNNNGGLTEAVYGNGISFLENGNKITMPKNLKYDGITAKDNYVFSQSVHSIEKHLNHIECLYSLI